MSNLVVGAGLSGSVLANLIATKLNEKVVIIDKRSEIAGNIYDYINKETGIIVHKYGPHIFHTNNKKVWDYLSEYTKWHPFILEPNAVIQGKVCNIPFNLNTLYQLFSKSSAQKLEKKLIGNYGYGNKIPILKLRENPDNDLKFLSNYIYENMFKNYTIKQWGVKPEEIDLSVTARVPVQISYDNRYFQDKYQGIPLYGYTKLIENILNHPNIKVVLNKNFKDVKDNYDRIFYSGSIDEYFYYKFGQLPYRSLEFEIKMLDMQYYQKSVVTNYPNEFNYTRITEHKYFLNQKSDKTIISLEYPKDFKIGVNERFYPVVNKKSSELYEKYYSEIENVNNLYFIGRLGAYQYLNMDAAVEKVFELFKNVFGIDL